MGDNISQRMRSVNRRIPANLTPGIVLLVLAAIVLLIIFSTSFIVVDQTERAVITTFGKFTSIAQPGLAFKWPFGIQKAYHVKTEIVQTEQFGFRTDKAGVVTQYSQKEYPEESTMLTGDLNIISVEWIIQYKITDPKAWLFNVSDREKTIRDISQSVVNLLVGDRTILGVIGPERTAIQEASVQMMNEKFTEFGLGIRVTQVQLQNIVPPKGVQDAFEDVNKAIQDMNRLVNEGKEAYNSEIPKAQGQAEQMREVAKGYAAERVNEAKGDVARFNSVYSEYRKAPDVTKQRLYYEMMEDVFKGEKNIELIDKHFTNFLPLKNLVSSSTPVPMPASEPAPAPAPAPAAAPAQTTEAAQ
jgi:membrane protease subunit HflK